MVTLPVKEVYVGTTKVLPWPDYLCFTADTAWSTVKLSKNWSPTSVTLQTSTDWFTWSSYTIWNTITLTNAWDKVYFRNTNPTTTWFSTWNSSNYYIFVMTGSIYASWDVTSLINKNTTNSLSSSWNYTFARLFYYCTSLKTAPKLPATTLTNSCYYDMFSYSWIKKAPILPATTLAAYCYAQMFANCTSLTNAPSLPATTLASYCYYNMFNGCTSLITLPVIPATTLTDNCCYSMFYWCSNIKVYSSSSTGSHYRIPVSWTWTAGTYALRYMFNLTWWWITTPSINTTYTTPNSLA